MKYEKDETQVLNMSDYIEYSYNRDHYEMLCMHGKTMVMMYQATGESRYLVRAKQDLQRAKSISSDFIRPLGVQLVA